MTTNKDNTEQRVQSGLREGGGERRDIGSRRMSELRPEVGAAFIESGKSGQGVVPCFRVK